MLEEVHMSLVSIVVPVYNMGTKISKCVDSLLKQTYSNLEIILVDDGSKDDSLKRCKEIAERDSRVRVYHTENRGSGPARNYGIEHAKGDYVYFPDADDFIAENTISVLIKATKGYDLVVFGYKNIDFDGNLKNVKRYPELVKTGDEIRKNYSDYMTTSSFLGIQGAPWNKFFSLDLIKANGISFPALRRHQDEGFIARYMTFVERVHFIPDVLYTYYTNDLSREWDKYPVDYIDAVIGLLQERKSNILLWNQFDTTTHDMVYREYICNFIKALELSFSPKFGFNITKRWEWMMTQRERIVQIDSVDKIDYYHSLAYSLLKDKSIFLYLLLWVKVWIEKNDLKKFFR